MSTLLAVYLAAAIGGCVGYLARVAIERGVSPMQADVVPEPPSDEDDDTGLPDRPDVCFAHDGYPLRADGSCDYCEGVRDDCDL